MKKHIPRQLEIILQVEKIVSRISQDRWRGIYLILIAGGTNILILDRLGYHFMPTTPTIGITLIMVGFYLEALMLHLFSSNAYYRGLPSTTGSGNYTQTAVTYDLAKVILSNTEDITKSFLTSTFGEHIYVRAELDKKVITDWLNSSRHKISYSVLSVGEREATTLLDLIKSILVHDQDFVLFLTQHGITSEVFYGCSNLVLSNYYKTKKKERWWSRDELSLRGSLGRTLTLGAWRDYVPYTYAIPESTETLSEHESYYQTIITDILQSRRDSNIYIITPTLETFETLITKLQHSFVAGTALGSVNAVSLISIDHDSILLNHADTISIEAALREILTESSRAGNMVIVIEHLTEIVAQYLSRGVQFLHILEEFLTADRLHVIIASTDTEYSHIKREAFSIIKRCQEITIEQLDESNIMTFLIDTILPLEEAAGSILSYQALQTITNTAIKYETPTTEVVRKFVRELLIMYAGQTIITGEMALSGLSKITHLPIGPITNNERDVLLSLESILKQYIVGQERALNAIGTALRRTRANLNQTDKPLASFLFLGPSGVGKTETAKALAKVYYGGEDKMVRLDMTEYADTDSLSRLIGNESTPSTLETLIINTPTGLILLDEFEKAHADVVELFLQILDEGIFTTYQGNRVNLRNHLIIATSNAGSDLIARTTDKRAITPALDSDIIYYIIHNHLLPAELIGRFGDVILFDALTDEEEVTIASQIISSLVKKTHDRGFELNINSQVASTIVEKYKNNLFGARPIRHAIEHVLEDIVAKHIIRGDVKPGGTINITAQDVKHVHSQS